MDKLKVIELFAGFGTQSLALKYEKIPHEIIGISEIDKHAIQAYEALHGPVHNYGDITKIEKLDYADFWTYSSPCTNFSIAGKEAGGDKESGTASSLIWEVERLLRKAKEEETLPKYLMLENVKNMLGPKHKHNFDAWIEFLETMGYNNYYSVFSATEVGVPQKRERIFVISIRQDIDDFNFSMEKVKEKKYKLKPLKEYLEKNPQEDIYLTEKDLPKLKEFGASYGFGGKIVKGDVYTTIVANYDKTSGNSGKIIRDEKDLMADGKTPRLSILTPRESMYLMGVSKEDTEKLYKTFENKKRLYKLAGNAIVIDVMRAMFRELWK